MPCYCLYGKCTQNALTKVLDVLIILCKWLLPRDWSPQITALWPVVRPVHQWVMHMYVLLVDIYSARKMAGRNDVCDVDGHSSSHETDISLSNRRVWGAAESVKLGSPLLREACKNVTLSSVSPNFVHSLPCHHVTKAHTWWHTIALYRVTTGTCFASDLT